MVRKYDYLIIGSGVAGMSFALKVAKTGTVALVCKSKMEEANTDLAQGGVATVTNLEVDNFEKHIHDTMVAGDWLSDPEAVKKVVTEAPAQIQDTASSASCTMPTIRATKSRCRSSRPLRIIPISTFMRTTSLWKSSPSTTWAKS